MMLDSRWRLPLLPGPVLGIVGQPLGAFGLQLRTRELLDDVVSVEARLHFVEIVVAPDVGGAGAERWC